MRLVARWGMAVAVSAAAFGLCWWICQELIGMDEGTALGIAGAVLAVVVAVAAWWAPRGADGQGPDAEPRDKTGNVTNTISGGTQHGPVLQGRDFTNLTFDAPLPA